MHNIGNYFTYSASPSLLFPPGFWPPGCIKRDYAGWAAYQFIFNDKIFCKDAAYSINSGIVYKPMTYLRLFGFLVFLLCSCKSKTVKEINTYNDSAAVILKEITPSTKSVFRNSASDSINAIKVSLVELKENLEKYDGKYIETEGIFSYGFETIAISGSGPSDNRIVAFWLEFDAIPSLRTEVHRLANHRIRIRGKLDKSNTGHLNGYTATITGICYLKLL